MSLFEIIFGGACVLFVVIIHSLEGMHLMEMIEKKWPAIHSILISRTLMFVLLVVAIALVGEAIRERWSGNEPAPGPCSSTSTGPATASGTGNIASSGNCNGINGQPKGADNKQK